MSTSNSSGDTPLQRYIFCPGILDVHTNAQSHLHEFIFGIPPAWEELTSSEPCKVSLDWRVVRQVRDYYPQVGQSRNQSPQPEPGIVYTGRDLLFGKRAELVMDWAGTRTPSITTNSTYQLWAGLRGTHHEMAGTVLSHMATTKLLLEGYSPLHCACVETNNSGVILVAPSNTGKTLTSWKLTTEHGFRFLSEDIAITDGRQVFGCAYTATGLPHPLKSPRISPYEWLKRKIFLVWFNPSLANHIPSSSLTTQTIAKHLVFLTHGSESVTSISSAHAANLLLRSNRLEFRHLTNQLLVNSWYLTGQPDLHLAAELEKSIIGKLVESVDQIVVVSSSNPAGFARQIVNIV